MSKDYYVTCSEMAVIRLLHSQIGRFLLIQSIFLIVFYGMQIDADIIGMESQAFRRSFSEERDFPK